MASHHSFVDRFIDASARFARRRVSLTRTLTCLLLSTVTVLPAVAQDDVLAAPETDGDHVLDMDLVLEEVLAQDEALAHSEQPAHYVVVQTVGDAPLDVRHYQTVVMDGHLPSRDAEQIDARVKSIEGRQHTTAIARLRDDVTGEIVWQDAVKIPRWLRSEVTIPAGDPRIAEHGGSNIDGIMIPAAETTFVVRAPIVEGATTLEVTHGLKNLRATETLDLADLARRFAADAPTKAIAGAFHEGVPGHFGGPPSNRLDVLFVAEGYSASSDHWFQFDTDIFADRFLGVAPWDAYAPLMNFYRLFVPSNQNGADRPACADSDGDGIDSNVFVDTAFDATFCSQGIWRLLTVDNAAVLTAAAQYPNWDEIIVVVQTPYRGGSGGPIATTSLGPGYVIDDDITGVMVHEFAHSYGDLADEYETANPDFPMCSDTDASSFNDCEANVTNVTSRSSVKWNRWIASSTPVPSGGALADPHAAGLWEGARYLANNMYRQCFDGMMRNTLADFCDVDGEALILKLYQGGWGSPSGGVSMVESTTRVPSSTVVTIGDFESVNLSARVIGPNGSTVRVRWYVDGVLKSTQYLAPFATASYTHRAGRAGSSDVVQMRVREHVSPTLHSTQLWQSESVSSWTVQAAGCTFC